MRFISIHSLHSCLLYQHVQNHQAAMKAWEAAGSRPFRQQQQTLQQAKQSAVEAATKRAMDHRRPHFATVFHTLQEKLPMTKYESIGGLLQHLGAPVHPDGWSNTTGALASKAHRVSSNDVPDSTACVAWIPCFTTCYTEAASHHHHQCGSATLPLLCDRLAPG